MCVFVYQGIIYNFKNPDVCDNMDGTGNHYATWNKPDT
jgi:hypothetical protein